LSGISSVIWDRLETAVRRLTELELSGIESKTMRFKNVDQKRKIITV